MKLEFNLEVKMEIEIVGFIGDNGSRYRSHVVSMRKHENIVYDLCNTSEEHVVDDMLKCDKIYVVGAYNLFSKDVWDCLSLASVCGKDIRNLDDLPVGELNKHTVDFLRRMADGLESAYNLGKIMGVFD